MSRKVPIVTEGRDVLVIGLHGDARADPRDGSGRVAPRALTGRRAAFTAAVVGPMSAPRIGVYAATFPNRFDEHHAAARRLGLAVAEQGATAVYGGGCTGLMGAFADAALEAGANVVGFVPRAAFDLEREHGVTLIHRGVSELRIVGSMHERKACMAPPAARYSRGSARSVDLYASGAIEVRGANPPTESCAATRTGEFAAPYPS
jgi:SLOG-like protein